MIKIFYILIAGILLSAAHPSIADGNAGSPQNAGIQSKVLTRSSASWDGSALPNYPQGTPQISVIKMTIAPGAKLPLHKHPTINAGYVLSGELVVTTEAGNTIHLKAGDAVIETVNTWHNGMNPGSVPAEIVIVYVGTADTPLTIIK